MRVSTFFHSGLVLSRDIGVIRAQRHNAALKLFTSTSGGIVVIFRAGFLIIVFLSVGWDVQLGWNVEFLTGFNHLMLVRTGKSAHHHGTARERGGKALPTGKRDRGVSCRRGAGSLQNLIHPVCNLSENLGVQRIQSALPLNHGRHHTGLTQHFQVLRNSWLTHAQFLDNRTNSVGLFGEQPHDAAAGRIRNH